MESGFEFMRVAPTIAPVYLSVCLYVL